MLPRSDQMSLSDEKIKNILGHGKYDFAAKLLYFFLLLDMNINKLQMQ